MIEKHGRCYRYPRIPWLKHALVRSKSVRIRVVLLWDLFPTSSHTSPPMCTEWDYLRLLRWHAGRLRSMWPSKRILCEAWPCTEVFGTLVRKNHPLRLEPRVVLLPLAECRSWNLHARPHNWHIWQQQWEGLVWEGTQRGWAIMGPSYRGGELPRMRR